MGGWWVTQQHLASDLVEAQGATERELSLLAAIVQTQLQRGDYQALEELLAGWGKGDTDIVALRLRAANDFIIADYARPSSTEYALSRETTIRYSYRGEARLVMNRDLAPIHHKYRTLLWQFTGAVAVLALLLTSLLAALIASQREAQTLRARTHELHEANTALQTENRHRRQAEEALFDAKERAEVTLHSIGDAVITTDAAGNIEYLNPVAEQLTAWRVADATGRTLSEVFPIVHEVTRETAANPVERVLREGVIVGLANHTLLLARDGREIAIEDSAAPIRNHNGQVIGVVMVFHDVTRTRELTTQLSWHASHDSLTGLINRREFETHLKRALTSAQLRDEEHALLYIDLDQFKIVNDTCGHVAGDELLRQLSRLKQTSLRTTDTLARIGGDEFGVLLEHCPLEQATRIAENMRQAARDFRFAWEDRTFEIGVSIGLIPIHAKSGSMADVLSAADMACYAAKESGRNRVHVYRESDTQLHQRRGEMLWVERLNDALKDGKFMLQCQEIVPLNPQDRCRHFEVLVRLRTDDGSLVAPAAFLPAAERYNLMPAIDRWVVQRVLALETADGQAPRCEDCLTAVNLSGASLGDERFLEFLRNALVDAGPIAERICFEITETAAITNLTRAADLMRDLRKLGCRFALDDFGTGLSSFSYLKNLPVDFLKIDGSLVRGIVGSRTDLAMVEAINSVGHTLGIRTIAEFVESDAIRQLLLGVGVDYAQGYAVARPEAYPPPETRRSAF